MKRKLLLEKWKTEPPLVSQYLKFHYMTELSDNQLTIPNIEINQLNTKAKDLFKQCETMYEKGFGEHMYNWIYVSVKSGPTPGKCSYSYSSESYKNFVIIGKKQCYRNDEAMKNLNESICTSIILFKHPENKWAVTIHGVLYRLY